MKKTILLLTLTLVFAITGTSVLGQTTAKEFYEKGKASVAAGDFNKAIDSYMKAAELDASVLPAPLAAVMTALKNKDRKGGAAAASAAIKADPTDVLMYFLRATAVMAPDSGVTSEQSMADLQKVIELAPTSPFPYFFRTAIKLDNGDIDGAIADATKAIEYGPKSDLQFFAAVYSIRGRAKLEKKEFDSSIADMTKAIGFDPNNAEFYYFRAVGRSNKDDKTGAIDDYTKAIALNPRAPVYFMNRGLIYNSLEKNAEAAADLTKAIEVDPSSKDVPFMYLQLAAAEFGRKNLDAAVANLGRSIELNPKYADAYSFRGLLRSLKNDDAGALTDYNKAIELMPDNAKLYEERATIYRAMDKPDLAAADEKRAAALKKP